MGSSPKHIALYNKSDERLWAEAKQAVVEEYGAEDATEGEVLGQLAAAYIGFEGPLAGGEP